eukprot:CAMPEP_0181177246 /NCGR_PEP_ID=MMETSP1096-20121128/5062_1 /TAXON_ID=156174 ORGANISM="Chrysochromulina ericina, Strain CCMP281" /NCGR_SAMPLE_ID=MMETSP1096 /ASSEMBLY_ACC=CAM_ASM_000453 /LENGTH=107 /DNA_ID=CAMNT_0023265391 /DNA_START=271 /DNA_END=594 /DNA_ORIENTATION=+
MAACRLKGIPVSVPAKPLEFSQRHRPRLVLGCPGGLWLGGWLAHPISPRRSRCERGAAGLVERRCEFAQGLYAVQRRHYDVGVFACLGGRIETKRSEESSLDPLLPA